MDLSKRVSDGLAICGESHAVRLHYIPIFKAKKYSTMSTGEAWRREREREDLKGSGGELVCDLRLQGLDQIRILKSFTSFAQNRCHPRHSSTSIGSFSSSGTVETQQVLK